MAKVLRQLHAPGKEITDLAELGLRGQPDEAWMPELGRRGIHAMVTRDSSILRSAVRRKIWIQERITLFVLDGRWGNLRLFEQARGVIWWWPYIVSQAEEGPEGAAWAIAPDLRRSGMSRMFAADGATTS